MKTSKSLRLLRMSFESGLQEQPVLPSQQVAPVLKIKTESRSPQNYGTVFVVADHALQREAHKRQSCQGPGASVAVQSHSASDVCEI